MAEDWEDKTELPTEHRRQEVREKGNVARSVDLSIAASVMASTAVLNFMGEDFSKALAGLLKNQLGGTAWSEINAGQLSQKGWEIAAMLATSTLPILAALMLTAIAINFAQVGFMITPEALMPQFSRINPLDGFKRVFSLQSLVRLAGSLLKLLILTAVATGFLASQLPQVMKTTDLHAGQTCGMLGQTLIDLSFKLSIALLILAILDYGYQWWYHEQNLMMTKQELREEMRNMDGNPEMRQHRKEVHRKLITSQQLARVREADVIVTNPTELAVAIKYDPEKMAAPIVVAKGADFMAARIRQLAAEHNVPIIEKKPLARALYRDVKVGRAVPVELYEAVAEIMAFVYRLSGKRPRLTK